MVYRGANFDEKSKKATHPEFTCYAESMDGIQWVSGRLKRANGLQVGGRSALDFDARKDCHNQR